LLIPVIISLIGIYTLNRSTSTPLTLAMVTTLSGGPQASQGQEARNGAQLYIDAVNQAGGVNGHLLKLQVFDDKFDATQAGAVARQVIASPALLMLGPAYSATALPVNKIYSDARIPLITASVSSDVLTQNNPFAFRLRTLTSSQGNTSAIYVNKILGMDTASIVYADEPAYGQPIANAFESMFTGHIAHKLPLSLTGQGPHTLESIVTTLTNDHRRGIVFLAMTDVKIAGQVIVALRSKDPTIQILCTDAIDSDLLATSLKSKLTDGVYASAPVIYDSAPDEAQSFASQYQQKHGSSFGWFGAKYYEAAQVAVAALQKATIQGTLASLNNDRAQIVHQLSAIDSPQNSVEGLDGPLYFDGNRNGTSPIRFGQFSQGRLRSLPTQLMEVSEADRADLPNNTCTGELIQIGDQCF
jgi:branched-chain amino acid transport system substrate-binding protein